MSTPTANNLSYWKLALIPTVLAFILYANTISHQYALDDGLVLQNNTHVQKGLAGLGEILSTNMLNGINGFNGGVYRPTLLTTFAFEIEFFGNNPTVSHLFNVIYYMLTAFLLSVLLFRLFKNYHVVIPLSISLLFIAHPVHTEAVANLKGRDEILAFIFSILSMIYFVKYIEKEKIFHVILAMAFYGLAFISKESTITLMAAIPVMLYFFTNADKKKIYTILGILVVFSGVLFWWHTHVISSMEREMDAGIVSALNNSIVSTDNLIERLATAAFIQLMYVWKLVVPYFLVHDYSFNQIPVNGLVDIKTLGGIGLIGGMLFVAFKGLIKKDPISFGILFFFFTIATVANVLIYIGVTFAERFLYTPSLGYAIVLGMVLPKLIKTDIHKSDQSIVQVLKENKVFSAVLMGILVLYSVKTIDRNGDWENNNALFSNDVNIATNSARIHYNWGTELYRQGVRIEDQETSKAYAQHAASELQKAVQIFPGYLDAWNNLGNSHKLADNLPESINAFNQAIAVDPTYSKAYYNAGHAFFKAGDYQNSITYFETYASYRPNELGLYHIIGKAYGNLGDFDNAIRYFNQELSINPTHLVSLKDLGTAYGMKKDFANSIVTLQKAVEVDPNDAVVLQNIAVGYHNLDQPQKYAEYMQKSAEAKARLQQGVK